jgi:hypothetical protein
MHQNQLRFFEDLLFREVRTETTPVGKSKKPHDNFNVSDIGLEKSSVLQYLRDLPFHILKEKELVWIINIYFRRAIDLINRAYRCMELHASTPAKIRNTQPYAPAVAALQEILSFLERQYGKYMDLSMRLPIPQEIQLKGALVSTFLAFKAATQVSPELLETVETPLAKYVEAPEAGETTYSHAFYLLSFITFVERLPPPDDASVVRTLIAFNFNSPGFIQYYIRKLEERPDTLALALKQVNQVNTLSRLALNPLFPSAQEQLSTWLRQEIDYQEKHTPRAAAAPLLQDPSPAHKITTTLSVPQLANMLKLFSDLGIIVHDNKTELLETFASMFRTEKTENISAGSLRNNFYNEDASVSRSVRDLLLIAVNKSKGII